MNKHPHFVKSKTLRLFFKVKKKQKSKIDNQNT